MRCWYLLLPPHGIPPSPQDRKMQPCVSIDLHKMDSEMKVGRMFLLWNQLKIKESSPSWCFFPQMCCWWSKKRRKMCGKASHLIHLAQIRKTKPWILYENWRFSILRKSLGALAEAPPIFSNYQLLEKENFLTLSQSFKYFNFHSSFSLYLFINDELDYCHWIFWVCPWWCAGEGSLSLRYEICWVFPWDLTTLCNLLPRRVMRITFSWWLMKITIKWQLLTKIVFSELDQNMTMSSFLCK